MILGIIEEVYSKSARTISIAALLALWSASKGFFRFVKVLEQFIMLIMKKLTLLSE